MDANRWLVNMDIERSGCPCCGYDTVGERGRFDICPICWWEDDGQDNEDAHVVFGGPNSTLSLDDARKNFLLHGKSDPKRTDLKSSSTAGHTRIRFFEISDNGHVIEKAPKKQSP